MTADPASDPPRPRRRGHAHVWGIVCLDPADRTPTHRPRPRATSRALVPPLARRRAADSLTSSTVEPGLQLHSRPPRQRLPSSLVIESVSAYASGCSSGTRAETPPMNANDKSGVIAGRRLVAQISKSQIRKELGCKGWINDGAR